MKKPTAQELGRKETIETIVQLIEDKKFPALRSISDYIIILLTQVNVDPAIVRDCDNAFDEEYKKYN